MVTIVGAGSWGTALAVHLARAGAPVRLCARTPEVAEAIRERRRHPWYLGDVEVPSAVEPVSDPWAATAGAEIVVVAVPSEFFEAGALYELEVIAIEESGNQTIGLGFFTTR